MERAAYNAKGELLPGGYTDVHFALPVEQRSANVPANADIGIAKAAYYPAFNLNALFGVQAAIPSRLFAAPADAWSPGPSIHCVLHLVDGGKRATLTERARAACDEAAAQWRQTVLDAYDEVEDSLASLRLLTREIASRQAAVSAAAAASTQATRLYAGGLENYYDVIVTQNIELNARLAQIGIQTRRTTADMALIKTLGGGWDCKDILDGGTLATAALPATAPQDHLEIAMLELRPNCECCNKDLPPDSEEALICSFECTFCTTCAEHVLASICPNCGGELVARPRRPAGKLAKFPASTKRVFNPDCAKQSHSA